MTPESITSPQEALSHLFFHCCFRDGHIGKDEIKVVADKLVAVGLDTELNFTDEVLRYQSYKSQIKDEETYLTHLVQVIHPLNELALFSLCIELCLSDGLLQAEEEALLLRLDAALGIDEAEQTICKKIMVQRKVVETTKVF